MFFVEASAMPGYVSVSPFGKEWEPVTMDPADSRCETLDEAVECVRDMWEHDRKGVGKNDSRYRVRRLADQQIVFTKG